MCEHKKTAVRVGAATFALSLVWILGSDLLVGFTLPQQYQLPAQHLKGFVYVAFAAGFVSLLTYHRARQSSLIKAHVAELANAQRLKTSALVAFGAWHDIKNVATAFSINAQYLRNATPRSAEWDELLVELNQLSQKLVSLTDSLDTKRLKDTRGRFDPATVAANYLHVLNRSKLLTAGALLEASGDIPSLIGSVTQFEQMLANLVLNGDQATAGAHPVKVVMRATDNAVTIDVIDRGAGISPEVLSAIWEPLFTTKAAGSGLGLLVVKEAVADFGGAISVTSTPGAGTCFAVRLPVARR